MPSFLSDRDKAILQQLITWWKNVRVNTPKDGKSVHKFQSPDIYVALPPSGGIPALTLTGSSPATGDTPGSATCDIYRLDSSDNLEAITGLDKTVFNFSSAKVQQWWIIVERSKQGKWVVINHTAGFDRCNCTLKGAITSSGTGSVTFTVDNVIATMGISPVSSSSEELTVDNFFGFDADDNANAKIEFNHDDSTWELYQVDCPV